MVFYLTGTGNYLYVAKQLEENSILALLLEKVPDGDSPAEAGWGVMLCFTRHARRERLGFWHI